jgi:FtsP/CotA-like multicopper oxidase with cupredoxin domain
LVNLSEEALKRLRHQDFRLERGGGNTDPTNPFAKENEWLINGLPFMLHEPLARPKRGYPEVWTIENGGGGWTHPMHFHQEEHRVLSRNGVPVVEPPRPVIDSNGTVHPALVNGRNADDWSKEDTIAHAPGETVVIYRNFRTFPAPGFVTAPYVAHCHNLAHEDHNMMFGFEIVEPM